MEIVPVNAIPEGEFVFGMYNIETKEMTLGIPKAFAQMRGFHFEFMAQLTPGLKSPEQMIGQKGKGKYAGFGFIREGATIWIHPISSLKAAGKIGDINTVNPLLPRPNYVWPAMLPQDLALEIFSKLAIESGLTLSIDDNLLYSERFEFNERKYGARSSVFAKSVALRVKLASTWIGSVAATANDAMFADRLKNCSSGPSRPGT